MKTAKPTEQIHVFAQTATIGWMSWHKWPLGSANCHLSDGECHWYPHCTYILYIHRAALNVTNLDCHCILNNSQSLSVDKWFQGGLHVEKHVGYCHCCQIPSLIPSLTKSPHTHFGSDSKTVELLNKFTRWKEIWCVNYGSHTEFDFGEGDE